MQKRFIISLLVVIATSFLGGRSPQASVVRATPLAKTNVEVIAQDIPSPTEPVPAQSKLYTDEEIRKLAKYDIDEWPSENKWLLGFPCLDVVPAGESYPRADVFKTLGIEDSRIQDFRCTGINWVVFLSWQVSPSYRISCMSGTNLPGFENLEMTDPKRKVYGIRLVKQTK